MARLRLEKSFLRGCRRICVRPKFEKHLGNEEDDCTDLKGIRCYTQLCLRQMFASSPKHKFFLFLPGFLLLKSLPLAFCKFQSQPSPPVSSNSSIIFYALSASCFTSTTFLSKLFFSTAPYVCCVVGLSVHLFLGHTVFDLPHLTATGWR